MEIPIKTIAADQFDPPWLPQIWAACAAPRKGLGSTITISIPPEPDLQGAPVVKRSKGKSVIVHSAGHSVPHLLAQDAFQPAF